MLPVLLLAAAIEIGSQALIQRGGSEGQEPAIHGHGVCRVDGRRSLYEEAAGTGGTEWVEGKQLVMPPDPSLLSSGGATIWRDDNPNAAPDARYKSWSKMYHNPGSPIRGPHRVWKSPDGLRWTH